MVLTVSESPPKDPQPIDFAGKPVALPRAFLRYSG